MHKTAVIKYKPHPGQVEFHFHPARFRVLNCGRRWGKTVAGANEFIRQIWQQGEGREKIGIVGFAVAPTYWHTQRQWTEFFNFCPHELIEEVRRAEHRVILKGKRDVWFKSADNPDSLRSQGVKVLWVDEGAQIAEEAWNLALRPALMDEKGIAFFTGTPRGHNWYFQLYTRGQDPSQIDYKSWSFPSCTNPYLDPAEIASFARDMPELAYRQEVMAEFLEDVGSVFRGVDRIVKGTFQPPEPHKEYVMGGDLAKLKDFTVLIVLNMDGHLCAFDRFTQIDWVFQRKRIVQLAQQYNARLLIDSSGVGDPVCDELHRENVRVEGYKFTSGTKKDLIENLSMMIESQKLTIPPIPELINELKLCGYKTTPSGNVQYGAPEGYHDDCVTALALAAWQLKRSPPPGIGVMFGEPDELPWKKGNIYNHPFFH
jgi:hypothetical protein